MATKIVKTLKFPNSSDAYQINAVKQSISRATKSILTTACEQPLNTEEIWFGGSDAVTAASMPETYCVCNIKKGDNHRTLIDCYCLTNGNHYINSNTYAYTSNTGTWTGWKLQPDADQLDDYLPKSGGTMTGDITFGNSSAGVYIHDDKYDFDVNAIRFYSDALQIGDNGYDMTLNSYQDLIHYREDDENEVFEYKIVDEYNAASLIPAVLNDAGAYVPYAEVAEYDIDGNSFAADYLLKQDADDAYLKKTDASNTYATKSALAQKSQVQIITWGADD